MAFAFEKEIISSYLPSRKGCDALLDIKALEDSVVIQASLKTLRPFLQISVDGEIYVRAFVESLAFDFPCIVIPPRNVISNYKKEFPIF